MTKDYILESSDSYLRRSPALGRKLRFLTQIAPGVQEL